MAKGFKDKDGNFRPTDKGTTRDLSGTPDTEVNIEIDNNSDDFSEGVKEDFAKRIPHDMIQEILQKTHDGDDLSPMHLKLIEIAVNGDLSEKGEVALYELYDNVRKGYTKPWFLGVENFTQDHEGYVYYKGKEIEHYSHMDEEDALKELKELERRLKILESKGIEVNSTNAIWKWNDSE